MQDEQPKEAAGCIRVELSTLCRYIKVVCRQTARGLFAIPLQGRLKGPAKRSGQTEEKQMITHDKFHAIDNAISYLQELEEWLSMDEDPNSASDLSEVQKMLNALEDLRESWLEFGDSNELDDEEEEE
jgi:hypothetical protein